jgi:hypothetical protein
MSLTLPRRKSGSAKNKKVRAMGDERFPIERP